MFEYYTALLIVTTSIVFSAITVVYFDDIFDKFHRNILLAAYIILLVSNVLEWIVAYLTNTNSNLHFATTFAMSCVLCIAPSMILVLAWGITDKKSKWFSTLILCIIVLTFTIGFSGLFSDAIFYFDEHNLFHRGEYFYLTILIVLISSITLFFSTYRLGRRYQSKNTYIIIIDLLLFYVAFFVHFSFKDVWVLWISCTITITLLYIYYSALINQIDILTGLLNRKCFDAQLYDLNTDAIILFFDVNKFKEINDSLGHGIGDYCLVEIANAIKEVYEKSGYCYRIGGDEFSVILYKNLDLLDELNTNFSRILYQRTYKYELPSVSIGYSYYYPNKSSVQKVMEEADSMMYALKQEKALGATSSELISDNK